MEITNNISRYDPLKEVFEYATEIINEEGNSGDIYRAAMMFAVQQVRLQRQLLRRFIQEKSIEPSAAESVQDAFEYEARERFSDLERKFGKRLI